MSLIISLVIATSIACFFLTSYNKKLGAITTVVGSLATMILIFLLKDNVGSVENIYFMEFKLTYYGWGFALLMSLIYACVSFFNIYWMKKIAHPGAYNFLFMLSLAGTLGVFFAKTFIVLFIFWEIIVWASMFIIPFGKSRKASVVYYVFSAFGSLSMLYAIIVLFDKFNTLDIETVLAKLGDYPQYATLTFILFALAALVKLGVFPFHTWLPLAHGNAPDTFSPILSGGLVKVGGFGAFLIVAVLPSFKAFAGHLHIMGLPILNFILVILGAISIVVGTLMAIKSGDFKKLIAYSSVANGGYMIIGLAIGDNIGLAGALMHIFAHAIASAAAFLSAAAVSHRTGTTKMNELGGLIHRMPFTYLVYLIAIISMAGIPPMSGFISKWMIFQTLMGKGLIFVSIAAFFGSIGSFLYVFRPLSAVFLGQLSDKHKDIKEAPLMMQIPMWILSLLTLIYGIVPKGVLNVIVDIQKSIGMKTLVLEGTKIVGTNGKLDPAIIAIVFGVGFVIAFILFMVLPKARKVDLMDTYTASEFIWTPELLHYSNDFYAPFERLYQKHPSIAKWYGLLVYKIEEFGKFTSYMFFSFKPMVTVFWFVLAMMAMIWGGRI